MGNLFGKSKKQTRVTEEDKAVLQLKQQRDRLRQYQRRIGAQLERDRQVAKELIQNGKKDKAKLLLRKKRFQENILSKTDGQLENIERMIHDLEYAQIEAQVLAGLKSGNEALNKMHQIMSIEDVERIMDETQEAVEYQREIDELLAGGLSEQDEDDVLEELDQIIAESMPAAPAKERTTEDVDVQLPDVPTDKIRERERAPKQQEAMLAS